VDLSEAFRNRSRFGRKPKAKVLIIKSAATMTVDNALSAPLKINEGLCDAKSKQRESAMSSQPEVDSRSAFHKARGGAASAMTEPRKR
jgi:hypothetical protein